MTNTKHRKLSTIALVTILAISVFYISIAPKVSANTNVATYAYITASPNPVGVGQTTYVVMWIDKLPPVNAANVGLTYNGYTVTITKPDGSIEKQGPFVSDYVGTKVIIINPSIVGTYSFQFNFPQQTIYSRITSGQPLDNYTFIASSAQATLTVQTQQIEPYPDTPLPSGYWQRPIEGENRLWSSLGGYWLGAPLQFGNGYDATGCFNPYTTAPNSAHIVWTKPLQFGGIVGGPTDTDFYTGMSYEEKWVPPAVIVIAGRMYYHLPISDSSTGGGLVCVDIRTGQQYWWQNITVSLGQMLIFDSPNQHGLIPYLWSTGSTYRMYDPFSGNLVLSLANASTGRIQFDDKGNMLVYILNAANNWLAMWNSTRVSGMMNLAGTGDTSSFQWRPTPGATLDWRTGIQWNVTIPSIPGQSLTLVGKDVLVTTKAWYSTPPNDQVTGYDAHTGQYLWAFNITDFADISRPQYNFCPIDSETGNFAYFDQAKTVWYGYDSKTGRQVWGPTDPYENPWGVYSQSYRGSGQPWVQVGYGRLYATAYDGTVHCYDLKTGQNVWNYFSGSAGYETIYGNYPMYGGVTIADGKVYITNNEHSPNSPNWRGGKVYCIDANTGDLLWSVLGWMPGIIIADGYMASLNCYDGQVYSFGKGQTATTVQTPLTAINVGSTIAITGTVTDQSPGSTCLGIPAAGTPAVSDDSMSHWMEYLYMQKPQPTNATGVEVQLVAIDSNGVSTTIGSTTTNTMGFFNTHWKVPTTPGDYQIIANFAGTNSYYTSSAIAAITVITPEATAPSANDVASAVVSQLPTQAPFPTVPSASDVAGEVVSQIPGEDNTLLYVTVAAVFIAILIGVINLVLQTRKK
jgi:outer membrane protein assembly factor BamB